MQSGTHMICFLQSVARTAARAFRTSPQNHRSGRLSRVQRQRGQTTTEYVLVLSTLVIAVAGVSYAAFFGDASPVREGMKNLLDSNSADSSKTNIPTAVNRGFVSKNPQPN